MTHPLDGPLLKVRRAECQFDEVGRIQYIFSKSCQYKIVRAEFNPKTAKYVYRILVDLLPPVELGILIGEIAHNLRSALDQLVYQLGLSIDAPEKALTHTQFPVFLIDKPDGCNVIWQDGKRVGKCGVRTPHFNCRGRNMIAPLSTKHQAAIERLQPCQPDGGGESSPLWLLNEVNSADKHRLLQVIGSLPVGYMLTGGGASDFARRTPLFGAMLEDGAPVFEAPAEVEVHPIVIPAIGFREGCSAVQGRPVGVILRRITDHVLNIVEGFRPEFA